MCRVGVVNHKLDEFKGSTVTFLDKGRRGDKWRTLRSADEYNCLFDFSNHTLRQTGGRMMWKAGVELETISSILGHEDTRTTIDYLRLNLDDMSEGIRKLAAYTKTLKFPEKEILTVEPGECGGPKEIWTLDLPVISRALQPG